MDRDPFEELSEAAERTPDDPWVWLRLAKAFQSTGGIPIAKHFIERAQSCAKDDAGVWLEIGALLEGCRDDAAALVAHRRVASLRPGSTEPRIGLLLLRMNQPAQAETALRSALLQEPSSPELAFGLARALVEQSRFVEARQILESLPAMGDDPAYLQLLATVAHHQKDGTREVQALRRLRARSPQDGRVALELARVLVETNDADGARRELETLESDPETHYQAGRLLMRCAMPLAAARHLAKVRDANPELPETHADLARAFEAAARWPEAIESYQRSLLLDGGQAQTLFGLGRALAAVGNLREASTVLVRAAALAPEDEAVRTALTRVLNGARAFGLDSDLHLFSLPQLIEFLSHQHATGTLEITSPRGRAQVRMLEGRILQAGWEGGETLADGLVALDLIDAPALESVRGDNALILRKLSEAKLLSANMVWRVLASQVVDGLVEIIVLREGRATFHEAAPPGFTLDSEMLVDPRFALLEATRRIDELNVHIRS